MDRLRVFSRLMCPSTELVLQGSVMAAATAALSRATPVASPLSSLAAADAIQASRLDALPLITMEAKLLARVEAIANAGSAAVKRSTYDRSAAVRSSRSHPSSQAHRRLDRLLALDPTHPAGLKLKLMIRKARPHLFVFVRNRDLEPINNGSERALRPCAVYRKITNGFRQEWAAHLYADVRSVIETARRRSIRAIDAIRLALKAEPLHQSQPASA